MNMKNLANHYPQLTPEERFRLIMAANDRGDEAEGNRLMNAGQRIQFSCADHAPYAHAFHELLFSTYIELLEDATTYQECDAQADRLLRDSINAAQAPNKKNGAAPKAMGQTSEEDAVEHPEWHRAWRAAYAMGFLFKVKLDGWKFSANA